MNSDSSIPYSTSRKSSPPFRIDFPTVNHRLLNPLKLKAKLNMKSVTSWTRNTTSDAGLRANCTTMFDGWVMKELTKNINGSLPRTLNMLKILFKNSTNDIPLNPVLIISLPITLHVSPNTKSGSNPLEVRRNPETFIIGFQHPFFFFLFIFLFFVFSVSDFTYVRIHNENSDCIDGYDYPDSSPVGVSVSSVACRFFAPLSSSNSRALPFLFSSSSSSSALRIDSAASSATLRRFGSDAAAGACTHRDSHMSTIRLLRWCN
jgi:hypothetical protein